MDQNSFTVALLLILAAAATPLVHCQLLSGLTVTGRLCCTPTGTCPGGPGIPGVVLSMSCNTAIGAGNGTMVVGLGVTNQIGGFTIDVPNLAELPAVLLNLASLPCSVTADLPIGGPAVCPGLSIPTGTLVGVPTLVNTVLSPFSGLIGNFVVPFFVLVP